MERMERKKKKKKKGRRKNGKEGENGEGRERGRERTRWLDLWLRCEAEVKTLHKAIGVIERVAGLVGKPVVT